MVTTLTRADRCDRCGAAAQVRVEMTAGELLFCGHCFAEHKTVLSAFPGGRDDRAVASSS